MAAFETDSQFDISVAPERNERERQGPLTALSSEVLAKAVSLPGEYDKRDYGSGTISAVDIYRYHQEQYRGTYNSNNGMIAFVDKDLCFYVAPDTSKMREALIEAGFRTEGIYVPFSNSDLPVDSKILVPLVRLQEEARDFNRAEESARRKMMFEGEAAAKSVSHGAHRVGSFWQVDGIEYRSSSRPEVVHQIEDAYASNNVPIRRAESVGHFCANNGIIAFVNEEGRLFIGRHTEENVHILRSHGYRQHDLYVPLSSGQIPLGEREQLVLESLIGTHDRPKTFNDELSERLRDASFPDFDERDPFSRE